MGFKTDVINGAYRVKPFDEPSWVIGLQAGDGIVAVGNRSCLVVAFSVWSTPDREAAYRSIEVAKANQANVHIYLLPYDYPDELKAWLHCGAAVPGSIISTAVSAYDATEVRVSQDESASPVWFAVHQGKITDIHQGALPDDKIASLLSALAVR